MSEKTTMSNKTLDAVRVNVGSKITIHYSLSTEENLVDSTEGGSPLEIVVGQGQLHPGLEKCFVGRHEGERFTVDLDASLGFGEKDEALQFTLSRVKLPAHLRDIQLGASFEAPGPDRRPRLFRVVECDEKRVTLDGNHPLAGQALHLEAEIVKVI